MIDSQSYMNDMRSIVESGKSISMIVSGSSMVPFLVHQRDTIYIEPITRKPVKGDMVFFQRRDGQYIMHRISKVRGEQYWFAGDAHPVVEGPIERDQMFGLITKVCRKGKWIQKGDFWWDFFEKVWINVIPARLVLMKLYGSGKRKG